MDNSFFFSTTAGIVILLVAAFVTTAMLLFIMLLGIRAARSQPTRIPGSPQTFAAPGYPPETSQSLEERTPVIPDESLYRQPVLGAEIGPYALPPRSPDTRQQQ